MRNYANYSFVGDSTTGAPSIVDLLGPWPQRITVIVVLVAGVMAALMLPWHLARQRRER